MSSLVFVFFFYSFVSGRILLNLASPFRNQADHGVPCSIGL